MARPGFGVEKLPLPREVRLDRLLVVVREGERAEDLRGTEARVALRQRLDRYSRAMPSPEVADRDARIPNHRRAAEEVGARFDVRVVHADGRKRHRERLWRGVVNPG